jgi:hypothetical protein
MTYRIAHLSDLHLTGADEENAQLHGLFGVLREYGVDHVVITGDVSENGQADAFRALDEARREYGYGPARSTVLIGNHDLRGQRAFARRFGRYRTWERRLAGGRIKLVALDSTFEWFRGEKGHAALNARGLLSAAQWKDLAEVLRGGTRTAVVLALHDFVFDCPQDDDKLSSVGRPLGLWGALRDADELIDLAAQHGVPLVLSGHNHVPRTRVFKRYGANVRCVIGGATFDYCAGFRYFDFRGAVLADEGWISLCEDCWETGTVVCEECDDDAEQECAICEGSGVYECSECEASGSVGCERCDGEGDVSCGYCGEEGCGHCDESGRRTCSGCDGHGELWCGECEGEGVVHCDDCDGRGHVECEVCEGAAEVPCSARAHRE